MLIGNQYNYFTTQNWIDYKFILKHLHPSMATAKEHMNQERQGLRSTKVSTVFQPIIQGITTRVHKLKAKVTINSNMEDFISKDIHNDAFPVSDSPNICTNKVCYTVCSLALKILPYLISHDAFPTDPVRTTNTFLQLLVMTEMASLPNQSTIDLQNPSLQHGNTCTENYIQLE